MDEKQLITHALFELQNSIRFRDPSPRVVCYILSIGNRDGSYRIEDEYSLPDAVKSFQERRRNPCMYKATPIALISASNLFGRDRSVVLAQAYFSQPE